MRCRTWPASTRRPELPGRLPGLVIVDVAFEGWDDAL